LVKIIFGLFAFLVAVLMSAIGALIICFFFLIAWNYIAPLFKLPHLGFWQSFSLVFLLALVGSFFHSKITLNKDKE